jgi:hypothetical protein
MESNLTFNILNLLVCFEKGCPKAGSLFSQEFLIEPGKVNVAHPQ